MLGGIGLLDWDSDLDGVADGWSSSVSGPVTSKKTMTALSTGGKAQTLSLQTSKGAWGYVRVWTHIDVGPDEMVSVGDTLHVTARLSASIGANTTAWSTLRFADEDWQPIEERRVVPDMGPGQYAWDDYEVTMVVPSGTAHIHIFFWLASSGWGNGKLNIDQVSIAKEVDVAPAPTPDAVPAAAFNSLGKDTVYYARRFGLLETHAHQVKLACTFEKYNPNSPRLVYQMWGGCFNAPWAATAPNDPIGYFWIEANHPEWFLLDTQGRRVHWQGTDELLGLDVGDPLYQRLWTSNAIRIAKLVGADGIKIDNINSRYDWNFGSGITLAKYPDRASYAAAMDAFVRYAVAEIHRAGLLVIGNGSAEDWDTPPWSDWIQLFDGREYEPGPLIYQSANTWRSLMNSYRRFPDKLYVQYMPDPSESDQFYRFQFASFLIWFTHRTYVGIYGNPELWYHRLIDAPIGRPLGDGEQIGDAAYHRSFTNGEVFLNISGQQTQMVDVPTGMVDAVTREPVPSGLTVLDPHEALILIRG